MSLILTASSSTPSHTHPHLLPLHIKHSGPSPVSLYFAIHDDVEPLSSSPQSTTRAVFRGRAMHGIRMSLPDGYYGAVLRFDDAAISRDSEASSRKRVLTADGMRDRGGKVLRSNRGYRAPTEAPEASKSCQMNPEQGSALNVVEGKVLENPPDGVESLRRTRTIAHFNTLGLWNPDNPIDPQDEYVRAVNEWTRLAGVLHSAH